MIFELDKWIPGLTPENAWIVQVFAVVLAIGSAMLIRTVSALQALDLGVRSQGVVSVASMTSGRPAAWAISATAGISSTSPRGLPTVSA